MAEPKKGLISRNDLPLADHQIDFVLYGIGSKEFIIHRESLQLLQVDVRIGGSFFLPICLYSEWFGLVSGNRIGNLAAEVTAIALVVHTDAIRAVL